MELEAGLQTYVRSIRSHEYGMTLNSSIRTYVAYEFFDCRLAWFVTDSCGERIIMSTIKRRLVGPHQSFDRFSDVCSGVCAVSELARRIKIGEVTVTHKIFPAEASNMEGRQGGHRIKAMLSIRIGLDLCYLL